MFARFLAIVVAFAAYGATHAPAQPPAGPQVIEIEKIIIHGRRQAPAAFYVLHRANLGYQVQDLRQSFVRRIVRSTGDL